MEDVDKSDNDDDVGGVVSGTENVAPDGGADRSAVDYVNGDGDNADGVADA